MSAGKKRDQVTFQRGGGDGDEYGNPDSEWDDIEVDGQTLIVWGDLLEQPGRERLASGRPEAARAGTLRVWATPETRSVTAADRAVVRGQVWNIRSIQEVGRRRAELEMVIEAGVAT